MTLDDKQLDDLLRAVQVPDSLKDRLREIPDADDAIDGLVVLRSSPKTFRRQTRFGWYALAAVAAAVALLTVMTIWPDKAATTVVDNNIPSVTDVASHSGELERLKESLQNVEAVILQQQIRRLEARLATLREQAVPVDFPENEQRSIALSLSCQAAMELGASLENVRDDLLQVVEHYPESQGALLASRMLSNENTKEEFHN